MARKRNFIKASKGGLTMLAYPGDGAVLLAFDLDAPPGPDFAGFAIRCTPPGEKPEYIYNRLNFANPITRATTPQQRKYTPSIDAPFQKFRWIHTPRDIRDGDYVYEASAMYFGQGNSLKQGESVSVSFEMTPEKFANFDFGFTRSYISSQAYAEKFHNEGIRPPGKKTLDYDTSVYENKYEWLGYHARKLLYEFIDECVKDPDITVDLFAYDIDEKNIVDNLVKLGRRLRAFLDNAKLHTKKSALEPEVYNRLAQSAGIDNVKQGHFKRFAHDKILIQKKNGQPVKVLTGSANFSVRGLYVQANNVLMFNDTEVAGLYEKAFEQAFNDKNKTQSDFPGSDIASDYFLIERAQCPGGVVAFSPHKDDKISLKRVADEIQAADSSVMFAIMELGGTGQVMDQIKHLLGGTGQVMDRIKHLNTDKVFSYGVTQTTGKLKFFKAGKKSNVVPFGYLKDKVPPNFVPEISGGAGQVIHHKFVVIDFNDSKPMVFTGSSNLAAGGERENGDNLIGIFDRGIATAYGVEAVRLLDHYDFRARMKGATNNKPLMLADKNTSPPWWTPYFDESQIKYHDRHLFSHPAD